MNTKEIDVFLKVIIAVILGGIIGIERVIAKKPVGIRKKTCLLRAQQC